MPTYSQQMQRIFKQYAKEVSPDPVSLRNVGSWAMSKGLWKPRESDILSKFHTDMASALREELRTDSEGRRYRAKQVVREVLNGKQVSMWADTDSCPRDHAEKNFAQRRKHIVGICHQLRIDVDHFNSARGEEPYQMILDFTDDVEEQLILDGLAKTA